MKDNLTEIVMILDKSGSMIDLTAETIASFNSFIAKQKKLDGDANLTVVLFDTGYYILHNGVNLKDVRPLTSKQYRAGGGTALLDAVGKTIVDVGHRLEDTDEKDRPSKVIVVAITDGEENSSIEYSLDQIKNMVIHQESKYSWKFIFIGANPDSFQVGQSMGIATASAYKADSFGTRSLYDTVSKTVDVYRSTGKVDDDWDKDLLKEDPNQP